MPISHFDDLLAAARAQAVPQRLLLVFASVGPPDDPKFGGFKPRVQRG